MIVGKGSTERYLSDEDVRDVLVQGLGEVDLQDRRVLVIIPDSTRTAPLPMLFRLFHELLVDRAGALDYLVALGTHKLMSEAELNRLVGVTAEERRTTYAGVNIFNHRWDQPETFEQIGTISAQQVRQLSEGRLAREVPVRINRHVFDYDLLIVCGPVFPHEVVGFSGGNKYFFPGISAQEVIDVTHWLGALITIPEIIGHSHTPVRALIDHAAAFIDVPKLCLSLVVTPDGLAGLYFGSMQESWEQAAQLSAQVDIKYVEKPFRRVLSIMPEMYDDLWTGAKGVYKVQPILEDGGEVVVYAPHITEISYTWGDRIREVGYHVKDYFVKQWDHFKDYPWGVLAHSTHVRGDGTYVGGVERPRIRVTLATGIPPEQCAQVNLGYMDPVAIDVGAWEHREDEGVLVVHRAGELLYRIREKEMGKGG
jgi:lactate racemase